jgi:hypothetical protein
MLPKLIHFVWTGPPMPAWAADIVQRWRDLNPEHEVMVHGDEVLLPEYAERVAEIDDPSAVSDLLRYSALARYGGWYADVDMFPLRPVADAERAWRLDGSCLYCGVQQPGRNETHPEYLNGAVLSIGTDSPAWPIIHEMITEGRWEHRTEYGPRLITKFAREHPDLVTVAGRMWWYSVPPASKWTGEIYRRLLDGDHEAARAYSSGDYSGNGCLRFGTDYLDGQYPFGIHFWAYRWAEKGWNGRNMSKA